MHRYFKCRDFLKENADMDLLFVWLRYSF